MADYPVVIVEYSYSRASEDYTSITELIARSTPLPRKIVGWLIHETDSTVTVCSDIDADNESMFAHIIPISNIVNITRLQTHG